MTSAPVLPAPFLRSVRRVIEDATSPESLLVLGKMIVFLRVLEVNRDYEAIFSAFMNQVEALQMTDSDAFWQVIQDMVDQHEERLGEGNSLYPFRPPVRPALIDH